MQSPLDLLLFIENSKTYIIDFRNFYLLNWIKEVFICTAVQIILWLFAQPVTGTLPRSIHALISSSIICLHFTAYCIVRCWRRCHAHWGGRGWDQHQLPRGSMTSCPTLPCTLRRSRVRPKPTPSRSTMSFRTLLAHCCHGHYGGGGRDQHQLPRVNDELPNSANVRGALNWKGG